MRAFSSARCTDFRLYIPQIKIGTNQRAPDELLHCWNSPLYRTWKQCMFYSDLKQNLFHKKYSHSLIIGLSNDLFF